MKYGGLTLVCLLCAFAPALKARAVANDTPSTPNPDEAVTNEGPYSTIWTRNVFDLKPPPPPPDTNKLEKAGPPPNVQLTGITTILGRKEALFMVKETPAPGKPPGKDESYIMTEGERQGMLEVMEINPKEKNVKIKVDGEVSTITFSTNAAPASAGGAPATMQGGFRPPGFTPPGFPRGGSPNSPFPSRPMRPSGGASAYSPQSQGYNPASSYQGGGYNPAAYQGGTFGGGIGGGAVATGGTTGASAGLSLPGFGNQTPVATLNPAPAAAPPEITGAILNLQKAAADNAGTPFPPLPPPFVVGGSGNGAGGEGSGPPAPPTGPPPLPPGAVVTGSLAH